MIYLFFHRFIFLLLINMQCYKDAYTYLYKNLHIYQIQSIVINAQEYTVIQNKYLIYIVLGKCAT